MQHDVNVTKITSAGRHVAVYLNGNIDLEVGVEDTNVFYLLATDVKS